jgi:hypothetical protein
MVVSGAPHQGRSTVGVLAEGLAADVNYGWALCPDCKPSTAVARAGAAGACEPGAWKRLAYSNGDEKSTTIDCSSLDRARGLVPQRVPLTAAHRSWTARTGTTTFDSRRELQEHTCERCTCTHAWLALSGSARSVHFATARQLAHHREHCSWQDTCSVVGVVAMIGSQLHNGVQQWGVRQGACFCWPRVHKLSRQQLAWGWSRLVHESTPTRHLSGWHRLVESNGDERRTATRARSPAHPCKEQGVVRAHRCCGAKFRFVTWATISSLTLAPRCAQQQQQCSKTNNKKFVLNLQPSDS